MYNLIKSFLWGNVMMRQGKNPEIDLQLVISLMDEVKSLIEIAQI
jgi:hypothetical protein